MSEITLSPVRRPLPPGGLRALLRDLGAGDAFGNPAPAHGGRLVVEADKGREGSLYFRAGRVYSASLKGFSPPVATRMLSGDLISDDAFTYLNSLAPDSVGADAVSHGYCTADDVEDIHRQMLLSTLTHLYGWEKGTWRWVASGNTDAYTIAGLETRLLVAAGDERLGQWDALLRNFTSTTKSNSVPQPGPDWAAKAGESTTPEIASILMHVDGHTTVAQIAAECGFTRFEIGARLAKAIADGILIIPDPDYTPNDSTADEDARDGFGTAQEELDDALSMVADAQAALASAEARLHRAQAAARTS